MSTGAVQILQKSLQDAHKSLEYSSNALKRLTGRDPAQPPYRSGPTPERRKSGGGGDRSGRMRAWSGEYDTTPASKRRDSVGARSRLAGRLGPPVKREDSEQGETQPPQMREERQRERGDMDRRDRGGTEKREPRDGRHREREEMDRRDRGGMERREREGVRERLRREEQGEERRHQRRENEGEDQDMDEEEESKPSLQSSVVATTAPPRPKDDPVQDGKSKMRNRRMFGFLMGTLQKFKDSEDATKNSEKEKTRKAIERKLEETEAEEKAAVAQEKKELFQKIRNEKMRVSRIKTHLEQVEEYEGWNKHSRKMLGYIQTRNKPPIFYLPASHNSDTTEALNKTTTKIEGMIKERQVEIDSMLAEATAPVVASEGGGDGGGGEGMKVEGGEEMEVDKGGETRTPISSSVREVGSKRAWGEEKDYDSGEASESD